MGKIDLDNTAVNRLPPALTPGWRSGLPAADIDRLLADKSQQGVPQS
ncbi:MAG: hypothetical protein HQL31_12790 [Planctomycetes bacterium]|nr:hypothetical protein [Planctomycetota bacterium]